MSWLIFLALSRAGSCNDNTVHWLQPKLQGVDLGMLQQNNAEKAWCYPTAAASLLGKLANDGKWISGMDEENKYPTNNVYNIEKVWGDYAFHENNTANLAFYTETNKLQDGTGTTLEKGREGIINFISAVDPTKRAEVVIHPGYPDNNTAYPLLLHIKPSCILFDLDDDNATKLTDDINATDGQILDRLNGNPANLDHTVVAYAISTPVDQAYRFKYDVAMNLGTDANPSGKQCNPTRLLLVNGEEHCIRNYTTINITPTPAMDTLPDCTDITGELKIPIMTVEIPNNKYQACTGITSLSFEENSSLEMIGDYAFDSSNAAGNLTIPSKVKKIGSYAFQSTSFESLRFEAGSLEEIGGNAFVGVPFAGTLTIPSSVEIIGQQAFYTCRNVVRVVFDSTGPSKLNTIGYWAFERTENLEEFEIPESVMWFEQGVFNHCPKLDHVIVHGNNPWEDTSLSNLVASLCHSNTGAVCIKGNGTRAEAIVEQNTCNISCCDGFSCTSPPLTEIPIVSTAPIPAASDNDDDDNEELSTGALVGIIVGGVVLLVGLAWGLRRQLKQNSRSEIARATTHVGELFF